MMLGSVSGIVTVNKVFNGEAPEMRDASSSEGSIFSIALEIVMKA